MFSIVEFDFIVKVVLAFSLGALIGFERELYHKPAGLRTNILVMLGAMLATYISSCVVEDGAGVTRIAANILTGLGFIGGGVILQSKGDIQGLTTAACIWICGVIGMSIGFGFYTEAVTIGIMTFIVLFGLGNLERYLGKKRKAK